MNKLPYLKGIDLSTLTAEDIDNLEPGYKTDNIVKSLLGLSLTSDLQPSRHIPHAIELAYLLMDGTRTFALECFSFDKDHWEAVFKGGFDEEACMWTELHYAFDKHPAIAITKAAIKVLLSVGANDRSSAKLFADKKLQDVVGAISNTDCKVEVRVREACKRTGICMFCDYFVMDREQFEHTAVTETGKCSLHNSSTNSVHGCTDYKCEDKCSIYI